MASICTILGRLRSTSIWFVAALFALCADVGDARAQQPAARPGYSASAPATGAVPARPVNSATQPPVVAENVAAPPADPRAIPVDFVPWWQSSVASPMKSTAQGLTMDLDNVVIGTLMHSPQVRVLANAPIIRQTSVAEAEAKFDPRTFMESRFTDTSDPVGNVLTTGGATRFIDQTAFGAAGIRKLTSNGAQLEVSQRMGYETNNSIYFIPNQQGNAKLALGMTLPLLNGAGKAYNSSLIVIAEIDSGVARDQLSKNLQEILLEVYKTYWDLYLQRAAWLQKRKLYENAIAIRDELDARRDVDVLGSQLVRARSSVATREAATIRYETSVANVESKLRALINDPTLFADGGLELVPTRIPNQGFQEVQLYDRLAVALQNRPEINQASKDIRAACVRSDVSKNELLPTLNFILGTYVSGLHGSGLMFPAYSNQFDLGRPSYSTGLTFDMPYGNRAARARYQKRQAEVRQLTNQLQVAMAGIRADVEIAAREVTTTYREMQSKYHAMLADQAEINYLTERWRLLPGDQQVAGVVLDSVLNAQERLADAEYGYASALVAYNVALVKLKWATGTLLSYEEVQQVIDSQDSAPVTVIEHPAGQATNGPPAGISSPGTPPGFPPGAAQPTIVAATGPTMPSPAQVIAPRPAPPMLTPSPALTPQPRLYQQPAPVYRQAQPARVPWTN